MAKEIQREIEASNLLAKQSTIDENDHAHAIITVDISDCFRSVHKQTLFDLWTGVASKDYPGISIQKGNRAATPSTPLLLSELA